jgi:hypothetical protein
MTLKPYQRLVLVAAAPTVWAVHFLVVYIAAAVLCERQVANAADIASATNLFATIAALGLIAVVATLAGADLRNDRVAMPYDGRTARSQTAFLSTATVMLAGVSAIAVIFQFLPAVFSSSCQ